MIAIVRKRKLATVVSIIHKLMKNIMLLGIDLFSCPSSGLSFRKSFNILLYAKVISLDKKRKFSKVWHFICRYSAENVYKPSHSILLKNHPQKYQKLLEDNLWLIFKRLWVFSLQE
jgi:hypothetical protein